MSLGVGLEQKLGDGFVGDFSELDEFGGAFAVCFCLLHASAHMKDVHTLSCRAHATFIGGCLDLSGDAGHTHSYVSLLPASCQPSNRMRDVGVGWVGGRSTFAGKRGACRAPGRLVGRR